MASRALVAVKRRAVNRSTKLKEKLSVFSEAEYASSFVQKGVILDISTVL
jgi:hypothetical protein